MPDKNSLLKQISEASFMLDDLRLFLDTHPMDSQAMEQYEVYHEQRKQLLKQFADDFYPLTTDCICTAHNGGRWTWGEGPAPWDTQANEWINLAGGI